MPEPADAGLRGRDLIGLGGLLSAAVIAGTVLGLLLDHAAGTEPVFTMAGVLLGILAGGLGFWARVRAALK
jgi:F0F1-type ATP synthase assembly protein I